MTKTFLLAIAVIFTLSLNSCTEEVKEITSQGVPVLDESYVYENPKLPDGLNAASGFINFDPSLGIPVVNNPSSGGGVFVEGGVPIFGNFNEINRNVVVTNPGPHWAGYYFMTRAYHSTIPFHVRPAITRTKLLQMVR